MLTISPHFLRRQRRDLVPQCSELATPIVRRPTSFQSNLGRLQPGKKLKHLLATRLPAQQRLLGRIHSVYHENTLGRVRANAHNLHGRLPV